MKVVRSFVSPVVLALLALSLAPAREAAAECRLARLGFTPATSDLQIAIWLEDAQGNYISTLLVTEATGKYGIGNRPGRYDFNSAYRWPYGRRPNALPVWAHKRNVTYPLLVFQDGAESYLSHGLDISTRDLYFCKPLEGAAIDVASCASWNGPMGVGTDKGMFDPSGGVSYYPPRNDMSPMPPVDSDDSLTFSTLNDLDMVTRATPSGGAPFEALTVMDPELPDGDYVLWIEVSRENDYNDTYNPLTYPAPSGPGVQVCCGDPYRGMPSVVYNIPFTLGGADFIYTTKDYVGYGDIEGMDGTLSAPDGTIDDAPSQYTIDQDGVGPRPAKTYDTFGAARLELTADVDGMWRAKLTLEPADDPTPPGAAGSFQAGEVTANSAAFSFAAPGDDGDTGTATQYEIRYLAGTPLTEQNFLTGTLIGQTPAPVPAGQTVGFTIDNLLPQTRYYVGVRAKDDCLVAGPITFLEFVTAEAEGGDVDSCFVATAAWGSLLAAQVQPLRRFRDSVLRTQALGELFVEAYYTFGPALAEVIEPSSDLRGLARAGLGPLADFAATVVNPGESNR